MAVFYVFFLVAVSYIAEKIRAQLAKKMEEYVVAKIKEYVALPIGDYLDTPIGPLLGCLLYFAVLYIAEKRREIIGEVGHLFFYKSSIKNLRTRRENLEKTRDDLQRLVDDAGRKGEVVLQNVQEWLTNVNNIMKESTKLVDDELQLNLKLLYRRSRYAKRMTVDVDNLIQVGNNFVDVSTSAVRFGSRERIFKDIMEALKDDKIKLIGIYGMPGVGKTTLAKQVMQQAKDDKLFDEVLPVVFQTPNWEKIRQQIEGQVMQQEVMQQAKDDKLFDVLMPVVSQTPDWEKIRQQIEGQGSTQDKKRVLIVLDHIWKNVEIPSGMKYRGWKVVLTSTKKDVYDQMGTNENFLVEVINGDEARNLFRKTAGVSNGSSDKTWNSLADEIAKECGGLPIAIVTIASAIKRKDTSFLRDVLTELRNSTQKQHVNLTVELSYRHVDREEAKKIFLLCCLFPEDYDIPIQVLMMYGMGLRWFEGVGTVEEARDRVHVLVHSLKSSCLLQDGEEEECVKMHDVIRDVAVKIASKCKDRFLVKAGAGSKEFPEREALNRYTAISLFSDDFHELPGAVECPKLEILLLGSTRSSSQVPNNFSLRTESPKVLNLFRINFSSPPPLIGNLKNLRTLCLTRCSVKDTLSIIGEELKNLEYLSFRESDIKELPKEIRMLTQLKLLDLTRCEELKVIPRDVIGGLPQLEGLYMEGSFDGWELERQDEERKNASLVELKRLSHLDIRIPDANLLPEDLVFEKLSRFKICIGTSFWRSEQFSHSKILKLELNADTALKDGIKELLKKVEHLQLRLRFLPGPINLWNYPAQYLYFHNLIVVKVEDCGGLKNLFSHSVAKGLSKLVELEVRRCRMMEEIVGNDREAASAAAVDDIRFPKLRSLKLWHLPNLKNFCFKMEGDLDTSTEEPLFGKKVVFPALETLQIDLIGYGVEIQHSQLLAETLGFRNLRSINIYMCNSLKSLFSPSMASSLVQLKEVKIDLCMMMESIIAEEGKAEEYCQDIVVRPERHLILPNLSRLVSFMKTLTSIFSRQEGNPHGQKVTLPAMEVLKIKGLANLKAIWHPLQLQAESTCQLKVLKVKRCHKISNVIPSNLLKCLTNLEEVSIKECDSVEIIFEVERLGVEDKCGTMSLPQLKKLSLSGLPKLFKEKPDESNSCITIQPLFNEWVAFTNLVELRIINVENLREIFHTQLADESFSQLRFLEVRECHKLSRVAPSNLLPRLKNLYELVVEECNSMENIFEHEGEGHAAFSLFRLTKMKLCRLPNLMMICSGNCDFELPLLCDVVLE